jgi:hypothetical protein
MTDYQFKSYTLAKETMEMADAPFSTINSFVFVTDTKEPNVVSIWRYHNHSELKASCIVKSKVNGMEIEYLITHGDKCDISVARSIWRGLMSQGFERVKYGVDNMVPLP